MFEIHSAKVQKNQNQKLNKFVFQSLFVCLFVFKRTRLDTDPRARACLVVADDVDVVGHRLLRGDPPAVHVLIALPLLLRLRWLFLQLLPLVLRPAVLEPDLHLREDTQVRHRQLSTRSVGIGVWVAHCCRCVKACVKSCLFAVRLGICLCFQTTASSFRLSSLEI